jgi:His-Xaa-Ser system protein HxsD
MSLDRESQAEGLPANGWAIRIDLSIYQLSTVLRASYKLTDRHYVLLVDHEANASVVVWLWRKNGTEDHDLVGLFCEELLEQRLRSLLEEKTHTIRDLVVAQAFAEGNLLDPLRDEGDYEADPLAIARSR